MADNGGIMKASDAYELTLRQLWGNIENKIKNQCIAGLTSVRVDIKSESMREILKSELEYIGYQVKDQPDGLQISWKENNQ